MRDIGASWLVRWPGRFLLAAACSCGIACGGGVTADPRITRIAELEDQIRQQNAELVARDAQLAEQAQTIQQLRGLSGDRGLDKLVTVDRIELASMSGGYDDDNDGRDDGVVAYLRLKDADGDTIKAAGSAILEAYDLAAPEGSKLVARIELDAEALSKLWFGRFGTSHYTIKTPWQPQGTRPQHAQITLVVYFTEMLSGRTFKTQVAAEVKGQTL